MASSSSSTPSIQKNYKYDVFLSYSGEDTRSNFGDHLYNALKSQGINPFIRDDERLKKGEISHDEVLNAVEDSKTSIAILSKNYASSHWCLKELDKILECRKTRNQTVFPVFYDVDPSDVRELKGEFGDAFSQHHDNVNYEKWSDALKDAANLPGWELISSADGFDETIIPKIVDRISLELDRINLSSGENSATKESRTNIPSTPSSITSSNQKSDMYDVFLNHGADTFKNFVEHLHAALQLQGINVYRNDRRIEPGKRINSKLMEIIEGSKCFISVFSKEYASSSLCLDELVKIMECQKNTQQTAYPVFYDVEPSELHKQIGAVGEALFKHENDLEFWKWKETMEEAANLTGWAVRSEALGDEAECIKKIVEHISLELRANSLKLVGNLVGMESRINVVESYIETSLDDVHMIGIKGIGGGGKTTLARAIYNTLRVSNQFDGISFVENVREVSEDSFSSLKLLQEQILSDVLKDKDISITDVHEGKNLMKSRLCQKKVLIVLDDVGRKDQLEALAGDPSWFKTGSIIIITTRDEKVLLDHRVNLIYGVNLLSDEEAIGLFSRYAFGTEIPIQWYEKLSRQVVDYAAGLPLTIKVLGSLLCGKDKQQWNDVLERLKTNPLKETLEILEISYANLEHDYKEIFLDVACFMKGLREDDAIRMLESSGFRARESLRVLEQKSLLTISNKRLGMHSHLQQLGWNVECRSDPSEPDKHSRLFKREEIEDMLASERGTEAIKGIQLEQVQLSPESVMNGLLSLKKLRVLRLSQKDDDCPSSDWKFDQGRQYFTNELCFLSWEGYPFSSLPLTFQAHNLVSLELYNGKIEQLWEAGEGKVLEKLRFLDLSYSKLTTLDLDMTPNLERLDLKGCHDLIEIQAPDGCLRQLVYLNLIDCSRFPSLLFIKRLVSLGVLSFSMLELTVKSLGEFPRYSSNNLPKLCFTCVYSEDAPSSDGNPLKCVSFNLHPCTKLESVSENIFGLQHLRQLTINGCIPEVPKDIDRLESLEKLKLSTHIKRLPDSICMLKHLKSLKLKSCLHLEELPLNLGQLECLEKLSLVSTCVRSLPDSICMLKRLKSLRIKSCSLFEKVPEDLGQLKCLEKLNVSYTRIKSLPDSVCMLNSLRSLKLKSCGFLEKLPEELGQLGCLEKLTLTECILLGAIPNSICKMKCLRYLHLSLCIRVEKLPEELGLLKCLKVLDIKDTGIGYLPPTTSLIKGLRIFGSASILQSCCTAPEM